MKKFLLICLLFITIPTAAEEYLSQDYIDTTINNAYYGFLAASKEAGGLYTQESAIANAREVVARMKKVAENDPNRRYILWRLSELEDQIRLEEEEISLKEEIARVKEINRLVKIFNDELFMEKPNFGKLHTLHKQVMSVSVDHANQFATNINQKNRVVVSEVREEMHNLFRRGDYEGAEQTYRYASKNRKYLNLGDLDYDRWSDKIQAKHNADYLRANIDRQMTYLSQITEANKIAEARRNVEVLNREVMSASQHLPNQFVSSTQVRLNRLQSDIDRREEELVDRNLAMIKGNNTDEALSYMNSVLRPAGVSPENIARIDRAILLAGGVHKADNAQVAEEIASMKTSNTFMSMDDINAKMKIKADSLRQAKKKQQEDCAAHFAKTHKSEVKAHKKSMGASGKNRAKADAQLDKVQMLLSSNNYAKAKKTFQKKQSFCFANATPNLYYEVKRELNKMSGIADHQDGEIRAILQKINAAKSEQKQEQAMEVTAEIYTLLEGHKIEKAYSTYYFNEQLLRENSYVEAFNSLQKMVVKEYYRMYLR